MKFVILAVLLGFLIAFIVMVVKAAKNWRWYHITSASLVMLLAIILLFPTAAALKSRQAWHKVKEDLEQQLARVEQENETLEYGDPNDTTGLTGVRQLSLELSKIGTEAGRRWRNLAMVSGDPSGQIVLRATPTTEATGIPGQPPADDADAPDTPLIPENLIVYGFGEGRFPDVDRPVPTAYLGEFRVTASQPDAVTITPTFPLEQNQADAIASGRAGSWSLYEMLPLDGHTPFIAEGSKPDDDNVLGRVNDELVNNILKGASPETRAAYLKDGQKGSPEDPAARWIMIRFDEKYTIDVDSPEQRGALEGGFFDNNGRAVDSRLQRDDGGSVSFAAGDTLLVKEEAARLLINQEQVASLVDTYYLRPLNDYRYVLRRIRLQIQELETRQAEMEYEKGVLEAAVAATVDMLAKGQEERLKLEQDVAQYEVENAALQDYHGKLREELRQVREASSLLYRNNFTLLRQIQQAANSASLSET
jgi:hypothetical protein